MCNEVINKAEFKWKPLTLSGGSYVFNAKKKVFANAEHEAAASFTLAVENMVEGGRYQLKIKKTVAGDITITLPASTALSGAASSASILLTGAANSYFVYSLTYKP